MEEEHIQRLLKLVPGSRRGTNGVILDNEEGSFYIYDMGPRDQDLDPSEDLLASFCSKNEILRLREIKTAHDYLLRVRSQTIANSSRLTRATVAKRRQFTKNGRIWSLTDYYSSMNEVPKRYINRLGREHRKRLHGIPFGFSPLPEPNAICLGSFAGEIVIVSDALHYFFYFLTIGVFGENFGFPLFDRANAILIALRIMNGSESLDFELDPRENLPARTRAKIQAHVDWMIAFTFGHEFAHLLLGHINAPETEKSNQDARAYQKDDEFAADLNAILLASNGRRPEIKLLWGAYSVFQGLHLLELVSEDRDDFRRFSISDTHPSALQRQSSMRRALGARDEIPREAVVANMFSIERLFELVLKLIEGTSRRDLLTFYGSIHLEGLGGKPGRDRIDF